MNKTLSILLVTAAALVSALAPVSASAEHPSQDADKGVNAEKTVRDYYLLAMHEAQTRLSDHLAQCDRLQAADHAKCVRDANSARDADVAHANEVLDRVQ
jgi:hypothetical protein